MTTVGHIVRKEFLQVFRNRAMLPIIFVMPIIQLLILANAATFEVRHTIVSLIDDDQSVHSRALIDRMIGSGYFSVVSRTASRQTADRDLDLGTSNLIMRIPFGFDRDLRQGRSVGVQVIIDAQDGAAAGVVQSYLLEIVSAFNTSLGGGRVVAAGSDGGSIQITTANWFNPELDYDTFMVPGILVLLVTMIGLFLSSMNLVREKEIGTIEQLNVTPIRKSELIMGKLLPFWIIALGELAFGLLIAKVAFGTPMEGSLLLIFVVAAVYLVVVLGIGLLVSTVTDTQQQAMFIAWFIMVVFILMSGLFTPIESMPVWAQRLTLANPVAHFIEVMRRVMLKGAGFGAVMPIVLILGGYALAILTLATRNYRKTTA